MGDNQDNPVGYGDLYFRTGPVQSRKDIRKVYGICQHKTYGET